VLFCNKALRQLLGKRPKSLREIAPQEMWRTGEEIQIVTPQGAVAVMLVELPSTGERREIYLLPLPPDAKACANVHTDFESIPVALMVFTAKGEIRAANLAAREILGDMLQGAPQFHDLFDALGRPVSDWLGDVAAARLPSDAQVLRLNKLGADRSDFVHVSLRRMVENARPLVLAVLQDANALKTLEAQFAQSQKMQAIGQLAGGVAHDFNNLLTAISGNCDLLLLRHMGDDPSYPDLLQIRQNANRAAALVAQLLAFSRKQTLQPEYLDLQDVFSDLTHLLNRLVGEKVQLFVQHGHVLGTIRADRRQLEQVIVNLVVNARDAMPKGGGITITTDSASLTADLQRDHALVPAGDYAKICVIDTGIGMAKDMLVKIFDPFFTTKKSGEGTGLGLSTAYGIVKQSGGYIFVDSALGQGTTFTLYFPIHSRPAQTEPKPQPKPAVMRQGEGVVLLVEDEAPVRAFAARALRLRGYTVLEAANGEEALDLLRQSAVHVDLFLSDVIMPGMDGPTWVREAQGLRPDVPVIFVSGYAEDVMAEQQQRIANSTFLPKPFSLADLTMAVQEKLSRGQHEDGFDADAPQITGKAS
jgi:two-component system cell cycle sensor histidine kinase/response regulator CckA